MKFIPSEQNKNYKVFDETGFYRSTVDNITEYFLEYDRMLRQFSLTDIERDVWILAMNYDFISYVAQKLCYYNEKGKTSQDGRTILTELIIQCAQNFILSNEAMVSGICAIVIESYPEPRFIKDGNSDYQAQKSVIWTSQMGDSVQIKEELVEKIESNDVDPNDSSLRRGENAIQCLMSNYKRKRNGKPITPLGLKKILKGSPGDEEKTEGSDSDSPAYNPTSPPSTVETKESYATSPPSAVRTTESLGSARTTLRYILKGCIIICFQYIRYVQGENPAKNKSVSSNRRVANSFHCPRAKRHSKLCQSATTLSMD